MNTLKNILIGAIIMIVFGLISLVIIYFLKFNGGFSLNPEHWYTSGAFIVSFLTFLVTIIIAIYVSEITKQSTRFPEQRKLYNEFIIMNDYVFELFHTNLYYMDFQIKIETVIRRLNVLKGESFIFKDYELYESAVTKYRDKLELISQNVSQIFMDNSTRFSNDNNARLGHIRLMDIDDKIFDEFRINDEAKFLIDTLKKVMR